MNLPDKKLVELWITQRNTEAFSEIAARHAGMVYGVCRRMLGNSAALEDTARACFLEVAQARRAPRAPLAVWLHAVAVEKAAAQPIGASAAAKRTEQRFATRSPEIRWDDVKGIIDSDIAGLPEKSAEPLILRFLEGHPAADVAQSMGLPREKVERQLDKGLELLRRALEIRNLPVAASGLTAALAANAVEACPAALTSALARLSTIGNEAAPPLAEYTEMPPLEEPPKSRRNLWLALSALIAVPVIILAILNRPAETPAEPASTPPEPVAQTASPPPVPSKPAIEKPETPPAAEGEEKSEPAISLRETLAQVLLKKIEEEKARAAETLAPISSRDTFPDNAAHFFFLAFELLPEADHGWLAAKWNELTAQGWLEDPELRAYLEACRESFAVLQEGLKLQNALLPPPRCPGEPKPYLESFKELAKALGLRAIMQASDPAAEHAAAGGVELLDFAWESSRGGMLDNGVASLEMGETASTAIRYALQNGAVKPEEYRTLIEQLQKLETRTPSLWEMASAEAQATEEWARTVFPDAAACRHAILESYPTLEMETFLAGIPDKEIMDTFKNIVQSQPDITYLSTPFYQSRGNRSENALANPGVIALMYPGFDQLPGREASAHAALRTDFLTAAIEWFGMENGQYPASLEELIPAYLGTLPKNPFTGPGQGFVYQPTETGYALYPAGNNAPNALLP